MTIPNQTDKPSHDKYLEVDMDDPSCSISTGSSSSSDLGPTACILCSKQFEDDQTFRKHMKRRHRHPSESMSPLNVSSADAISELKKTPATFVTRNRRRIVHKSQRYVKSAPVSMNYKNTKASSFLLNFQEALIPKRKIGSQIPRETTQAGAQSVPPKAGVSTGLFDTSVNSTREAVGSGDFTLFRIVRVGCQIEENAVLPDDPEFSARPGDYLLYLDEKDDDLQPLLRDINGNEGRLPYQALLKNPTSPWGLPRSLPLSPRGIPMKMASIQHTLSKSQSSGAAFRQNEIVIILKHDGANLVVIDYNGQVSKVKQWDLVFRSTEIAPPWGLLVDIEGWGMISDNLIKEHKVQRPHRSTKRIADFSHRKIGPRSLTDGRSISIDHKENSPQKTHMKESKSKAAILEGDSSCSSYVQKRKRSITPRIHSKTKKAKKNRSRTCRKNDVTSV